MEIAQLNHSKGKTIPRENIPRENIPRENIPRENLLGENIPGENILRKKSDDAFKLIKHMNLKIDFCYIDGCHYYDYFKNDYENCKSIMFSDNIMSLYVI